MKNLNTNIPKKTASFKENGDLNGYGLRHAVDLIDNAILPRSARSILSVVCPVAASTSAYKITKSRRRMAEECGTTEATIRRNLKKAVDAGILISTLVFDKSANGRGQMPTEYQFHPQFIAAAKNLCRTLDQAARDAIGAAKAVFAKALNKMRDIFCAPQPPRSELSTSPDQSDRQELVSFEDKKTKDKSASAEKVSLIQKVKSWADAKHERAVTKANDYAARQEREFEKREAERKELDKRVKRHAFVTGHATRKPATSQTTSHNAARFEEANREHDRKLEEAAAAAAAARARGPRESLLAKHFPNRKKTTPNQE